jgi:transcriptional regulator with XRE-family HTH domain
MLRNGQNHSGQLTGHALRNAHLRERALARAESAPPLARTIVRIRAETLGMTRLELSRRSGISRGTLRDLELGIHTPTRRILQQFVAFCQQCKVNPEQVEEVRRLYTGPGDTLEHFIARLELRAGSSRELARRADISPTTLWEYRRGNFPLRLPLLRRLCRAVGQDPAVAEALWHDAERQRFLDRGYPEALAEFWVLCVRHEYAERHLLRLGMSTATLRRLRYLELPPWPDVADVARGLCRDKDELAALETLWLRCEQEQRRPSPNGFGHRLKRLREQQAIPRRELADLFGIGGRKPARIIKHIEEDGYYSAQAYPAGLAAVLAAEPTEQARLLKLWKERRKQFHRRHRPEMRTDLRLTRELYGFTLQDMEPILGYPSLEYQRIERGVSPLLETARARILEALHQAGQRRVEALLRLRSAREAERSAWQTPPSLAGLVTLLARREGGLIPLARLLRQSGVLSFWPGRLRAVAQGREVPPWPVVDQLGQTCGVPDLTEVRRDWAERYRVRLEAYRLSPLGVELRLLIAETAATLRAFSLRLGLSYSILIRDLQRIDREEPGRWFHIERILRASRLAVDGERWREIHALWYTAEARKKKPSRLVPRLEMKQAASYAK